MSKKIKKSLPEQDAILPIRLLIVDIDGVMTDGRITYTSDGAEVKSFDVKDGSGILYWRRAGHRAGIITGRSGPVVEHRAKELEFDFLAMDAKQKLPVFEAMLEQAGARPEEVAMIGDDLPDLPLIRRAGLGVAVADAVEEVREAADMVTEHPGGRGAVREVVEFILKTQGKWDGILARYLTVLLFLLCAAFASAPAGEPVGENGQQAQPYEKIRYPTFADGRLQTLLEADQAEAYDLTLGTPRVNLRNVVITLYDHSEQAMKLAPPDQPLPIRMTITSDRGYFTRRPPEPGAAPEEIANLEGNVVLRQMRAQTAVSRPLRPGRLPEGVETEIHCEHAQWNNTLRKLNGDGEVEFLQEDSRIIGTGFLYLADDEALGSGAGTDTIKDWGGIVYIEHNARMEIDRDSGGGAAGRTEITCTDTASYKLREREIQFERDVRIRRPGLTIESDILKVFLRREDDPLPAGAAEAPAGSDGEVLPGQVRSIVATIGNRPGNVIVTGHKMDGTTGADVMQFQARGGRADFDYDTNRITLTDMRENRFPDVKLGDGGDSITDGHIVFVFGQTKSPAPGAGATAAATDETETVLENLNTTGGRGEVVLRARSRETVSGAVVPADAAAIPTVITYRGEMNYNRAEGRIRFTRNVALRRADLAINSESLDIRLVPDGVSAVPSRLNRILADDNVTIQTAEYEAKAQRAEYDIYQGEVTAAGGGLDTLRLYGPPHPWIRDVQGNHITAPEIHMQRLTAAPGQRAQHLMVARGSASCDFVTAPGTAGASGGGQKIVNIKCERGMEYNQANKRARFIGQVLVTSDSPEDSYVLTSDLLIIDFEETPSPDTPGEYDPWVRRITAEGNARLMQDARICEAINIIRDFPTADPNDGDIYLQGALPEAGRPPQMAVYREQSGEQIGAMFAAPLIKSSSRGDLIQANGPGQLSMPGAATGGRSEIHFEGASSYEATQGGQVSEARFWGGVRLVHPDESVMINADEMDARFLNEESSSTFGGAATNVEIERIGRLSRVEGRQNVRLVHALPRGGQRVAVGDVGVVDFTTTGNILRLTADRATDARRFVMARDHDGMTLRAPEIEIREAQGVTRAAGPGDLQIPANNAADGMPTPTRILYGPSGSLVYNELGLNIRVSDNVRIVQPGPGENWSNPGLDAICDRVDIALFEPPAANMAGGDDALSRVQRMDASGNVVLRVYAQPPADNPGLDWLSRPGTTFFTRGDLATYDVPAGQMSISSTPPNRPQLLLNTVESGGTARRQRLRADRFVLRNVEPRSWNYEGELNADAIPDGEPFEFTP